jgi:hypothetical protein
MVTGLVTGVILIVLILSALVNGTLGGPQSLTLVLWGVAGVTMLVILTRAYLIAAGIDRLDGSGRRHTVRTHILLHAIPLTYFPVAYAMAPGKMLGVIYLVPVFIFFITGVRTWKRCFGLFGTKLYKMFHIGNRQMLILFPAAVALDMTGWLAEDTEAFSRLMHVYFIIHFMMTGITVPLMGRDLRRYVAGSPAPGTTDVMS